MEQENKTNRRNFIIKSAAMVVGGSALLSATGCDSSRIGQQPKNTKNFPKGSIILFQGDSITDMHRNRKDFAANSVGAMGYGYPAHISGYLLA